jgi:hypothetical protein
MLAKLWFHHPDAMLYFEEAYGSEGMKIFKVKKEQLPAADVYSGPARVQ